MRSGRCPIQVSEELIGGYEVEYQHERRLVVYGDRLVEAEVGGAEAESDEPHDADEATTLWIDAGRITGGAETQLQLIKLVAPYFLVRRRNQRKRLVLRRGSEDWDDSELKFYAQNDMWRINLSRDLVASTGSLRDRTVMFTRLSGEDAYEFKVLTDQEKQSARSLSRRTGVYGRTSRREYRMVLKGRSEVTAAAPTVWLIHAGRQAVYASFFWNEGVVALGYGWVGPLDHISHADVVERLERVVTPAAKATGIAAMLERFYDEVRLDDLVVVPDSPNRRYLFGRVRGEYAFVPDEALVDIAHRRPIEWMAAVSRDELPLQVRRSLGSPMQLYRPGAQNAILSLPHWTGAS